MTSPADQPPPEPERGDPVRTRWAIALGIAGLMCIFAAFVLAGPHVRDSWVPPTIAAAAALVFAGAALAVLAFGGRQS